VDKRDKQRLMLAVALAGATFIALYTIALALVPNDAFQRFQSNVLYNLPGLAALGLATHRTLRSSGRERLGWLAISVALLCWQIADWSYAGYDYALGSAPPAPGFTDALYYVGYVALATAIPLIVLTPAHRRDPRWLLDAAILVVIAATISSELLLRPLTGASDQSQAAVLVAMGYPLLDLALASVLIFSMYATGRAVGTRAVILAAAVSIQVIADFFYLLSVAHGGYENVASYMDIGWLAAYVLIAVLCVTPAEPPMEKDAAHQPTLLGFIVPYCSVALLAAFIVGTAMWGSPPKTLVVGAVAALVLVTMRQTATMIENLRLYNELAAQMRRRDVWLQVQSDLGEAMVEFEDGRIVSANDAFLRISGYSLDQLRAFDSGLDLIAEDHRDDLIQWFIQHRAGESTASHVRTTLKRADGRDVMLELSSKADTGASSSRALVIARDITDRVRAEDARLRGEAVMRATLESTADGILVVDNDRRVIHHNHQFLSIWRLPEERALQRHSDVLEHARTLVVDGDAFIAHIEHLYNSLDEATDEIRLRDGRVLERYSRPLIQDGRAEGRIWSVRDVTERARNAEASRRALIDIAESKSRLEESLAAERERARRDPLTGALNHGAISAALVEAVAWRAPETTHAIVMCDVDGLKPINDTFGHQTGDWLLKSIAQALDDPSATVGRYGGDEFAVLLEHATRAQAEAYVASVNARLADTVHIHPETGASITAAASLGIAMFPDEAETVPDLIRLADGAMYATKRLRTIAESEGPLPLRRRDDEAVRLISELIPLLTSPGSAREKLDLISSRLAAAASYSGVRIVIFDAISGSNAIVSTSGEQSRSEVAFWHDTSNSVANEQPLRQLLETTKRPVIIDDVAKAEQLSPDMRSLIHRAGVRSLLAVPMVWRDEVIGSIGAGRAEPGAFSPRDAQLLATVAGQITAIVRMATLVESLQLTSDKVKEAQAETVMMLAAAAEAHDRTTGLHLVSIRGLAEAIALEMGYDEQRAYDLGLAATLHDIGKVSVPDTLLASSGALAADEWTLMQQHTVWGQEFLAARDGFETAAIVARSHHERWDGAGYPDGLAAEDIPEEAAIVTVADSFDAMTHDRPYRPGRTADEAVAEIIANSGKQFSPQVVGALARLHEKGALARARAERLAA
jgi:diguanylate cyclase (GGDEF)-like protein/PAS domain S-box-containing protein